MMMFNVIQNLQKIPQTTFEMNIWNEQDLVEVCDMF